MGYGDTCGNSDECVIGVCCEDIHNNKTCQPSHKSETGADLCPCGNIKQHPGRGNPFPIEACQWEKDTWSKIVSGRGKL